MFHNKTATLFNAWDFYALLFFNICERELQQNSLSYFSKCQQIIEHCNKYCLMQYADCRNVT